MISNNQYQRKDIMKIRIDKIEIESICDDEAIKYRLVQAGVNGAFAQKVDTVVFFKHQSQFCLAVSNWGAGEFSGYLLLAVNEDEPEMTARVAEELLAPLVGYQPGVAQVMDSRCTN